MQSRWERHLLHEQEAPREQQGYHNGLLLKAGCPLSEPMMTYSCHVSDCLTLASVLNKEYVVLTLLCGCVMLGCCAGGQR